MTVEKVNEQSTPTITVSFFDEDDHPVVPTSGKYMITDLKTGTVITELTDLPDLGTTVDIPISAAENEIVGSGGNEHHVLTVIFQYPPGKQGTEQFRYLVKDLSALEASE